MRLYLLTVVLLPQSHWQRTSVPSDDITVSFPNREPGGIGTAFGSFGLHPQDLVYPWVSAVLLTVFSFPQSQRQSTFDPSHEITVSFPNRVPGKMGIGL